MADEPKVKTPSGEVEIKDEHDNTKNDNPEETEEKCTEKVFRWFLLGFLAASC